MSTLPQDPWLLTPGPLTTSAATKEAMLHDWGSRDATFIATNARVLENLLKIANATSTHVCVPVQGSGTFAVEATLGTLIPKGGKALVLINGAYGQRMVKILEYAGRASVSYETAEDTPPNPDDISTLLENDTDITHVLAVHCETTSGILNPIEAIADVCLQHKRSLIIDAMSAFGAIELDATKVHFDAVMASSNKCLEGVPGMGFALIRKSVLEGCSGNAHALSLDLYDQWVAMEKNAQWRFTPPTHVIVAFDAAIEQFFAAGGVAGRFKRYTENGRILIDGMRELGFKTLLPDNLQAPIIITFEMPADQNFDFDAFYEHLKDQGYVIYPGKLTIAPSFRIGCIGALSKEHMHGVLDVIKTVLEEMNVRDGQPKAA